MRWTLSFPLSVRLRLRSYAYWTLWTRRALTLFVVASLLTLWGCALTSSAVSPSTPMLPPVLSSLQRADLDGMPGMWMDERDAAQLVIFIESIKRE